MTTHPDTFTESEVIDALESFLNYGEESYLPDKHHSGAPGHKGYFSGDGWPARVLRYHLDCLKAHQKDDLRRAEYAAESQMRHALYSELLKP